MKYSRQTEDTNRPSTLRLIDDQIIADFPYDDKLVAEIKAIDGAKWDKVSKVWRIPAVNMAIIRSFGMKYDFKITDEYLLSIYLNIKILVVESLLKEIIYFFHLNMTPLWCVL